MNLSFTVNVTLDRVQGKFASKDELAEQIIAALEGADESTWTGDNEGEYETTEWEVIQHD